ncbi:hypothetical protein PMAC_002801 [Pneumocystis sp. 'macacae']|nr:hypothetical protein PMAC_002801 [Pneumocystis sp. 'macacae']
MKAMNGRLRGIYQNIHNSCNGLFNRIIIKIKDTSSEISSKKINEQDKCTKLLMRCYLLEHCFSYYLGEKCSKLKERCYKKNVMDITKHILFDLLRETSSDSNACSKEFQEVCRLFSRRNPEFFELCINGIAVCNEFIENSKKKVLYNLGIRVTEIESPSEVVLANFLVKKVTGGDRFYDICKDIRVCYHADLEAADNALIKKLNGKINLEKNPCEWLFEDKAINNCKRIFFKECESFMYHDYHVLRKCLHLEETCKNLTNHLTEEAAKLDHLLGRAIMKPRHGMCNEFRGKCEELASFSNHTSGLCTFHNATCNSLSVLKEFLLDTFKKKVSDLKNNIVSKNRTQLCDKENASEHMLLEISGNCERLRDYLSYCGFCSHSPNYTINGMFGTICTDIDNVCRNLRRRFEKMCDEFALKLYEILFSNSYSVFQCRKLTPLCSSIKFSCSGINTGVVYACREFSVKCGTLKPLVPLEPSKPHSIPPQPSPTHSVPSELSESELSESKPAPTDSSVATSSITDSLTTSVTDSSLPTMHLPATNSTIRTTMDKSIAHVQPIRTRSVRPSVINPPSSSPLTPTLTSPGGRGKGHGTRIRFQIISLILEFTGIIAGLWMVI